MEKAIYGCSKDLINDVIKNGDQTEYYYFEGLSYDKYDYFSYLEGYPGFYTAKFATTTIKVDKQKDRARIDKSKLNGLTYIYAICGVDYEMLKGLSDKFDMETQTLLTDQESKYNEWMESIPTEITYKVNRQLGIEYTADKKIINKESGDGKILEIQKVKDGKYKLLEIYAKVPAKDAWNKMMIVAGLFGAGVCALTFETGIGLASCVLASSLIISSITEYGLSKIENRLINLDTLKIDAAIALAFVPLDLLGFSGTKVAIKSLLIKTAGEEIQVLGKSGAKVLLNGVVTEATDRMVVKGATNELVGYLSGNEVKNIARTAVLKNITVKATGELIDTNTGELLSVVRKNNILVRTLSKSVYNYNKDFYEVARFIKNNGKLPNNYIDKSIAKQAGWPKQTLDILLPGKTIGGDIFMNRELKLPNSTNRIWKEADVNFNGGFRGDYRLLYSNDGLYYITKDHYFTFTQIFP